MNYDWLKKEPGPRMLKEALRLLGTKETIGSLNNPVILEWAKTLKLHEYNADSIPWCGLFIAYVAYNSAKPIPSSPLWALSWAAWGDQCEPELGCVLTFTRNGGGHVGLYIGEDDTCYHVLGGNQGDAVSIVRIKKERLHSSRALYKNKPSNIRKIFLSADGNISQNES